MPDLKLNNTPGTGPLIRGVQGSGTRATADFIDFLKNNTETFSVDSTGLPDPGGGQATREIVCQVGDIVVDSDAIEYFLCEFRGGVVITDGDYVVDTDTADGSTNKQTFSIKRSSDDAEVFGATTAAANPGVDQATYVTLGAAGNTALAAGEYLYVDFTKTSTGLAMSGLTFIIYYTMSS